MNVRVRVSLCVYAFHSFICFVKCYICCFDFFFCIFVQLCFFAFSSLVSVLVFLYGVLVLSVFIYTYKHTMYPLVLFCFYFVLHREHDAGKRKRNDISCAFFSVYVCVCFVCVFRCATLPSHKNVHSF